MKSYKSVGEWLGEEENFSMRGERLIEQFGLDDVDDQDALVGWLQVAWKLGAKSAEAAIRADERERLAKLAEDDQLEADLGMDSTMREVRMPIARWIRSQGEGK